MTQPSAVTAGANGTSKGTSVAPPAARRPTTRRCPASVLIFGPVCSQFHESRAEYATHRAGRRHVRDMFDACVNLSRLPFLKDVVARAAAIRHTFIRGKCWSAWGAEFVSVHIVRIGRDLAGAADRLCGRRADLDRLSARRSAARELPPAPAWQAS